MLTRIYNKIVWHSLKNRINIIKTLCLNFVMLPFREAIRLPIIVYGPCKLGVLSGTIKFLSPVRRGMLKIGLSDAFRSYHSKSFVTICGVMEIGDRVVLRRGIALSVGINGHLILENDVYVGDNCSINSVLHIEIGKATRIGNNTVFMDTDFHYVINRNTREVNKNVSSIIIGTNCWIGGWCTVKKGCRLPEGTIVAGPYSVVGKDYTGSAPEYSLIAGAPAELKVEGRQRINNHESDEIINRHFATKKSPFHLPDHIDIERFCMPE